MTPGISSPCSVGQNIPEGFASNLGINTPLSLDTKDLIVICWVLSLESRTSFHLLHVKPHYQVRDENILSVPRVMRFFGTLTNFSESAYTPADIVLEYDLVHVNRKQFQNFCFTSLAIHLGYVTMRSPQTTWMSALGVHFC